MREVTFNSETRFGFEITRAMNITTALLAGKEAKIGVAILPSVHRIFSILGCYHVPYQRIEDIQFDANSYTGLNLTKKQIHLGLSAVQSLIAAYYPVAEYKAYFIPRDLKRFDHSWNAFITQEIIERKVWRNWLPEGETSEKQAVSLRMAILGTLRYLPQLFHRYDDKGVETISFEDEQPFTWEMGFNYKYEGDGYLDNSITNFSNLAQSISLPQLFYLVELLDFREKLALFKKFGYYRPNETINQHCKRVGTNTTTFKQDLIRGIEKLLEMKDGLLLTGDEMPTKKIHTLIHELEHGELLRTTERRILVYNSPRGVLFNSDCLKNDEFVAGLTDQERKILRLAMLLIEGTFCYSAEEIASELNVVPNQIRRVLKDLAARLESGGKQLINTMGKVIKSDSIQFKLIKMIDSLRPDQIAQLTFFQQEVFKYFTSQNLYGRYPTQEQTIEQFGIRSPNKIFPRILSKLSSHPDS